MSYLQDYAEADAGYLSPDRVDVAIEELNEVPVQDRREDFDEELAALKELRDQVTRVMGRWEPSICIVADDTFVDHVREETEDQLQDAGLDALSPFMDWERYARVAAIDYGIVVVDGDTFYVGR
jgi:hypothetical protein